MAPELCKEQSYDNKVDVWAAGILTFVLLAGTTPFSGRSKDAIYFEVAQKQPDWSLLNLASKEARSFLEACL